MKHLFYFIGLYQDAEAAMDYLLRQTQISRDKIIVFGRSLGGAVAIYLASHPYYTQHIHSVFIENTFTSLPEIGAIVIGIPIIGLLPYWCFKNQVNVALFHMNITECVFKSHRGTTFIF